MLTKHFIHADHHQALAPVLPAALNYYYYLAIKLNVIKYDFKYCKMVNYIISMPQYFRWKIMLVYMYGYPDIKLGPT